jgi:ribonuclease P protein component
MVSDALPGHHAAARPRGPSPDPLGLNPRASRRRGSGEDSTGRTTPARRFCDTPLQYPNEAGRKWPPSARALCHDHRDHRHRVVRYTAADPCYSAPTSFDTPEWGVISSPDDERAAALTGARRVCVPFGVGVDPGSRERIAHRLDDEADLPAQKAPSREGAWFPRPHADNRRPPRHRCSAGTWSEAADGLTDGRGKHPPRLVMLSRPQDFAALQGSGTSRSHPLFSARFLRTDLETTRFGLSTGRKLGGAVVRNRVRRRLREALRAMAPSFQPGWDVLIIVRPAIVDVDHEALVGALRRLLQRGGVLGGPTAT